MRPIKLSMQAFGPYIKPTPLDFAENLRGEKIFLIHGATGAGKTTILDAICFALYGTASGDERDAAMMRSKGVADKIPTEVAFTFALGEKIYSVSRTLKHYSNRKTNQNQITAKLTCGDRELETQASHVTNAIKDLLGFDVKQFRQVVLLPQGAFKNFLSARAEDRQPVLDTLFNAALYSRIEDGLKLKFDAAQKIFDDLQGDKSALTAQLQGNTLDAAALEKIRDEYAAAVKNSADLKKIFDTAQAEFTAGNILAGNFAELARRAQAVATAQNNFDRANKTFSDAKIEYDLRAAEQPQRDKLKSDADKLAEIKNALVDLDGKRKALDDAEKNFQTADAAFKAREFDAERFDARLAELKRQRNDLSGAEKNFVAAQTILDRARDRENILREISRLEGDLQQARRKISDAEKIFNAAQSELERLQKLQRDGSAALLAKNLRDGEPCPVCGSRTHLHVNFGDAYIPSDSDIDAARKNSDGRKKILDADKISAAQIQTAIDTKRDSLKNFSDVPTLAVAKKNFDAAKAQADALSDCDKRIAKGERCIADNNDALKTAREALDAAAKIQTQRNTEYQTLQTRVPEKYLSDAAALDFDIAATKKSLRDLDAAWQSADRNFRNAGNVKSSCEGALNSARETHGTLADKLKDRTSPDIDALKTAAESAQKNYGAAIRAETSLKNSLDKFTGLASQLAELDKKISAAEKNLRVWKKLSDVAGGKIRGNKFSFARYYLSAMFEQVLTEANYRLDKMSDRRYSLRSRHAGKRMDSAAGLNLEIFDDFTGETRPVATLSGGESFLASLSLALGLAAVVRNNAGGIKLDTIFIDEGFGSLDSETLDDAISTIIDLSGGRLVGIISHVEELKNQMPVRLEVTKGKTGSTAKFERGLTRD
ncbi:MAG: SMC family ATPase [Quinella sp. 1Q7]|nr:SMC family ATPase [Quinella sp. 1Q7]